MSRIRSPPEFLRLAGRPDHGASHLRGDYRVPPTHHHQNRRTHRADPTDQIETVAKQPADRDKWKPQLRKGGNTLATGYPLHSSAEQLDPVLLIMMSYVAGSTAAAGSASLWKSKFLAFTQPNWSEGDTQFPLIGLSKFGRRNLLGPIVNACPIFAKAA